MNQSISKQTILVVDDTPENIDVLNGILMDDYKIKAALDGKKALKIAGGENPPDLILLDIMMPEMDGYEVCRRLKKSKSTEKIPVIFVTAKKEVEDETKGFDLGAVDYITKPVKAVLVKARVQTHLKLLSAQQSLQDMLEKTLAGSIKVLTEVLALSNPAAFSRALRLKQYVKEIVNHLGLRDPWQFEIAAMLSSIGCLSLSPDTLERINKGEVVTGEEKALFDTHPKIGSELLISIPHLKRVAGIIAGQMTVLDVKINDLETLKNDPVAIGGQILKTVIDFDSMIIKGRSPQEAVKEMLKNSRVYNQEIVKLFHKNIRYSDFQMEARSLPLNMLRVGMTVDEDVVSLSGVLLLKKGSEVSDSVLNSLRRFSEIAELKKPIRVLYNKYQQ